MASLPLLLSLLDDQQSVSPYYGDDFGFGLHPHHIRRPRRIDQSAILRLPLELELLNRLGERQHSRADKGEVSNVGKDGFQVCMDVGQFKPNELTVKVVDNHIVVEGKHEEREDDHGYVSRHFVRRYALPKNYDAEKVMSTLSSDGVLTVNIPKPKIEQKANERIVQIQQTGPAHLNVKENHQEKKEGSPSDEVSNSSGDKNQK